jgi:two-component system alkaline phosphatase synthesis response regulator PhoP
MGRTILVVDDEPSIRMLVARGLTAQGFEVVEAADGQEALSRLDEGRPDLVVLDVVMPSLGGWDVLAEIRRRGDTPVIMLTHDQDESARIHGLDMGADDYLGKPFFVRELVARVRSVLRRVERTAPPEVVSAGGLEIEIAARRVLVDGVPAELTRREFELLSVLATNPNRALTIAELLEQVWDSSAEWQDKHTVAEHVRRLRQKIGDRWIETVRGIGYRFTPEDVSPQATDGLATV